MSKTPLSIIFVLAILVAAFAPAAAQERIRLAWAGASPSNSPIWAMQEKKLLEKQGLRPEIISISASPTVLQALLANEIDAASISVTTLTSSRLAGFDSVMIVGVVPTFVDFIVSTQDITKVEQLKGKTAGVNRLGSTSDMGLRLALRKLGIDPEKDVKIIPAGGNPERFAALSKGITQFTIMPEPFVREAERLGFRKLFSINTLKIPFWWNGILTREAILKEKRPLMLKLTTAMVEAIHYLKTDKEGAKALFRKNLGISDPEALERAYNAYIPIFNEAPYPTPEGVKTMLDDLARSNPKAAAADPKAFVDLTLVRELENSGFIKKLYKK
jgi:ABC-type nitrate/sulfonate/bicarbonate transport system substrate-binding protein